MQIDSHMHFVKDWDKTSISLLTSTNSTRNNSRNVLSYLPFHYKASTRSDTEQDIESSKPLPQLCGGYFSNGPFDGQIIRLNTTSPLNKTESVMRVKTSPFVVAGNLMTTSGNFVVKVLYSLFVV